MPEIVRLARCKICIYAGDHLPPHFHVRGPQARASLVIASLRLLRGSGQRSVLDEAIAWAREPENMARLLAEWRRLNERE